jgi:gliding motility-associated protein GldM
MAGGKETPRQKMIGMMYLVLTALLAMNVSKDILDAFVIINSGIETTNRNFENKNENTYNDFDKAKMNDPIKVTPFWQKAQQAKKLADELDLYMEELKHHLIRETDKVPPEIPNDSLRLEDVNSKDNYDIPTMILIGEPANPKDGERSAKELKGKISQFRDDLLNLIENPVIRQGMNLDSKLKILVKKTGRLKHGKQEFSITFL